MHHSAVSTALPLLLASSAAPEDASSYGQGHELILGHRLTPAHFACSHPYAIGREAQQALPEGRCSGQAVRPVHCHGESRGLQGAIAFQESSTESRACRCSSLFNGQTVCRHLNRQVAPVRVVSAATEIAHGLRCMLHCSKCQPVCWVQDCLKDKSMQSAYA